MTEGWFRRGIQYAGGAPDADCAFIGPGCPRRFPSVAFWGRTESPQVLLFPSPCPNRTSLPIAHRKPLATVVIYRLFWPYSLARHLLPPKEGSSNTAEAGTIYIGGKETSSWRTNMVAVQVWV